MVFSGGFMMFDILFVLVFLMVFGVFAVTFVRGIRQWKQNNHSPRLTVEAVVVAKRGDVSYHHHDHGSGAHHTSSSSTSYYVTFQVESGDRMELAMPGSEFGMLIEGDRGKLTFQGTRYLGFKRI